MTTVLTEGETSDYIGVRFQKLGKLYHFRVGSEKDLKPGDFVIVDTKRGRQLGQLIAYIDPEQITRRRGLRPVQRKATAADMVLKQTWEAKELEALITCREEASNARIKDAKFVKAQYSYDGSWLTIAYSTENRKLDLRSLQSSLSRRLDTRVEMQMVGPRDVAKYMGGYGACGIPRCCSTFLTEFSPISIKMAKEQGISLSPQEITGMCGRLRCCLVYEYEQYVAAKKTLPRRGKIIGTPYGEGRVVDVRVIKDAVLVNVGEEYIEVTREEIEPLEELKALKDKAEAGCSKHEGGGCDCGAKGTDAAAESE